MPYDVHIEAPDPFIELALERVITPSYSYVGWLSFYRFVGNSKTNREVILAHFQIPRDTEKTLLFLYQYPKKDYFTYADQMGFPFLGGHIISLDKSFTKPIWKLFSSGMRKNYDVFAKGLIDYRPPFKIDPELTPLGKFFTQQIIAIQGELR